MPPEEHPGRGGIHSGVLDAETIRSSSLYNEDLAPIPAARRSWGTYNYAALWIAMSVNIPTYLLASGMIAGGMDWKQAIFTVFLGNVLVLVPMLLNAHAGARYGIPFPVFARASFGVKGANVPAVLRALVACGWFGINTWIGGEAINAMAAVLVPSWKNFAYGVWICFALFWLLHVVVIVMGIRTIQFLQGVTAPFLLAIGVVLLGWAMVKAGGFGPMLAAPSKFKTFGEFFKFFVPSLTGVVGFWATVALNIPDFTRYARSQRAQVVGQALGLPATMTFYSFIGVAVTSATTIIFGQAIWDPVQVLARLGNPIAVVVAMLALLHGDIERERRGESRFAFQRFLESLAAPDQLSHRRPDRLRGRRGRVPAVEASRQLQQLYFQLAGGIFRVSRPHRGRDDLRLLRGAQKNHPGRRLVPAPRIL